MEKQGVGMASEQGNNIVQFKSRGSELYFSNLDVH